MNVLRNALLLTLVFALPVLAGTWEHDLAVADKLLENGYYEAAIEDYQKIVTTYADQTPAVDRAWFGMARAYQVTGNTDAAKLAAEKCLERNLDETAASGARELYRQMKEEAHLQQQELQNAVTYFENKYQMTSWLNIITKLFDYFDLRKARKRFAEADEYDSSFNPRYLIDPVDMAKPADGAAGADTFTLTSDEMNQLLTRIASNDGTTTEDTTDATDTVGDDTADVTVADETVADTTTTVAADPHADLQARRETYLEAYRTLQEALRGRNQLAIQQANDAFRQAQEAYKEAQQSVAALQN